MQFFRLLSVSVCILYELQTEINSFSYPPTEHMPRCSLATHAHTRDMMSVSANAFVSDESCNEM